MLWPNWQRSYIIMKKYSASQSINRAKWGQYVWRGLMLLYVIYGACFLKCMYTKVTIGSFFHITSYCVKDDKWERVGLLERQIDGQTNAHNSYTPSRHIGGAKRYIINNRIEKINETYYIRKLTFISVFTNHLFPVMRGLGEIESSCWMRILIRFYSLSLQEFRDHWVGTTIVLGGTNVFIFSNALILWFILVSMWLTFSVACNRVIGESILWTQHCVIW